MDINYKDIAKRVNDILAKKDLTLVDEFEEIFIGLENPKETSSAVLCANRQLLRYAYFVMVLSLGEKANLVELEKFLHNVNDSGRTLVNNLFVKRYDNEILQDEIISIVSWFRYEYFTFHRVKDGETYKACLPARYWIDKLVKADNIENGVYTEYKEVIPQSKTRKGTFKAIESLISPTGEKDDLLDNEDDDLI